MSSAFKFKESICWGTAGAIEEVLSIAAELSITMYGAEDPVSVLLADERNLYWGGKVIAFESTEILFRRIAIALEAARQKTLCNGKFTELGVAWLTGPLADFCQIGVLESHPGEP